MYVSPPQICGGAGLGSIDFGALGWEDYLLIGILGAFAVGTVFPSVFGAKPTRKRKPLSASAGFLGGLATPLLIGGAGYLAYKYWVAP